MNTTGIQNYLSNVFRPIYTWDTTASNFTPKLQLSNIDTYSGNTVSVFTAAIGDAASNVYVGSNAGNPFNTLRACSNITALGFGAASNISNDSNSVYIGWYAGASGSNSSNVISIGKSSGGNGANNIFLGTNTGTVGQSNVLIGHFITPSNVSNQIRIGYSNQIPIAADLSRTWVGLGGGLTPSSVDPSGGLYAHVDISGGLRVQGNLGVNIVPGTRTLDVNGNFRAKEGVNVLEFVNGTTQSTGGFFSVSGDVTVGPSTISSPIGTLKRGIVQVSTVRNDDATDRAASIFFAYTSSNAAVLSSHSNGNMSLVLSTSNIQISNTSGLPLLYQYSITYFPLL